MKIFALFSCVGALLFSGLAYAHSLADQMEVIRAKHGVPALGAAVYESGKLKAEAYTGVRAVGQPTFVQPIDPFPLGSCSKAMTATLIGMLVEEGKISWTSHVLDFFPEVKDALPAYNPVTIEMMLSHMAGFPHDPSDTFIETLYDPNLDSVSARAKFAAESLKLTPINPVGTTYSYSNIGYVLAGAIIDRVSGKSWERFIVDRLFKPLGMTNCGLGLPGTSNLPPDAPWEHEFQDGVYTPLVPVNTNDNPPAYSPAGRVYCPVSDWAKFIQMHEDGFNGKSGLLLKKETFTKLHSAPAGQTYTYGGWELSTRIWAGGPVLFHSGSNGANFAEVWIAPVKNRIYFSVQNSGSDESAKAADDAITLLITDGF